MEPEVIINENPTPNINSLSDHTYYNSQMLTNYIEPKPISNQFPTLNPNLDHTYCQSFVSVIKRGKSKAIKKVNTHIKLIKTKIYAKIALVIKKIQTKVQIQTKIRIINRL